jgi:hypothetical protein
VRGEAARAARRGRSAGERTVPERTLSCRFSAHLGLALRSGCCRRLRRVALRGRRHARGGCLRCRVRCAVMPSGGWALSLCTSRRPFRLSTMEAAVGHGALRLHLGPRVSGSQQKKAGRVTQTHLAAAPAARFRARYARGLIRLGSVACERHLASWTSAPFLRCPTRRDSGHARLAAPRLQRASGSAARVVHFKVS